MSAHGVPGAFASALSLFWKWILIAVAAIIAIRLFTYFVPELSQPNIKNYFSAESVDENGQVIKRKSILDYFYPGAIEGNFFSTPETPTVKYIEAPSIQDYEDATPKYNYETYEYTTYDVNNPY